MNAQRKKGAVNKYGPLKDEGKTKQEIMLAVADDEKKYQSDEIIEIVAEILNGPKANNPNKHYEEWRGENKSVKQKDGTITTTFDKLKKVKDVWITEETAATLNEGAESPNAANPHMYFLVND